MNLSFKDINFILEAIDNLLNKYNERLEAIEHLEKYEDEASDLENDCMFLESLKLEIEKNLKTNNNIDLNIVSKTESQSHLDSLISIVSKLSINERLLLVEAITQSIRKETNLVAS